ncbi:alpha/beta hydrolase [Maricaulis sp.]|uniref:alpha/beta hydrolase n=1 Tax=Maricaulis sp. TaxID=1486257 RepID=UPI002B26EEC2|nr:alpha/beta hydrolase [Maricaulis sp.]
MARFHPLFAILAALFTLAACTHAPARLPIMETSAADGRSEAILIATTRAPSPDPVLRLGNLRGDLSFARADVWVPSNRLAGEINHPSRRPDPSREFGLIGYQAGMTAADWSSELDRQLSALPLAERQVLVFVHGFNTPFSDGLYLNAQILNDFGVGTVAVHYAWPSAGRVTAYLQDRDSALFARDGLADLLVAVAESPSLSVTLLAHSMGAQVTMEALRQLSLEGRSDVLAKIDPVILAMPDIDHDVFFNQLASIEPPPANMTVLVSGRDHALRVSDTLSGGGEARLGIGAQQETLIAHGIAVLDLTGLRDGTMIGHTDFAASRTLMQLAASGALDHAFNPDASTSGNRLAGPLAALAAQIIRLPARAFGEN